MVHFRTPKLTEQRLEQHADRLIADPWSMRGRWRDLMPQAGRIHVDLGCGKGNWMCRVARVCQKDLFIGIDYERMCVAYGVERAGLAGLENAFFANDTAHELEDMFAPGEIDVLHINFPTPFPRIKKALERVTDGRRLMAYRDLLGEDGELHLKTDSQPLFDFTLVQLEATGYNVMWQTRDLHANPEGATTADLEMSAYEEKFLPRGAKTHALHAVLGPAPEQWEPAPPESLVDYLPEDLESITYIPHGMQDTVVNMRNRKRNAAARNLPK